MSCKTSCTPEIVDKLCSTLIQYIDDGIPYEAAFRHACRKSGIHRDTYYGWKERAETGEEPFASAVDRIESARFEIQRELAKSLLEMARDGSKEDGVRLKATVTALERLFPHDWSATKKHEHSGPDGGEIPVAARVVMLPPLEADVGDNAAAGSSLAPESGAADSIPRNTSE